MSNKRIDLTQLENQYKKRIEHNSFHAPAADKEDDLFVISDLIAELKRCYEVMNEVILRAMDAREEEASDIIKHGDEEYVHVDEITYPFSKSDIDAALDSKASE